MGLLIANDNLLTALGITNKEQFDQTFADFSEFETFVEKCGYEYDFDEEGNLILITPKSKEINTGIVVKKDYSKIPFYIEALEDGDYSMYMPTNTNIFSYSLDNKIYTPIQEFNSRKFFTLTAGQKLYFKGVNSDFYYGSGSGYKSSQDRNITGVLLGTCIYSNGLKFNLGGNIMSLYYDDFINETEFPSNRQEWQLDHWCNQQQIIDASCLVLPTKNVGYNQYTAMFRFTPIKYGPVINGETFSSQALEEFYLAAQQLEVVVWNSPVYPKDTFSKNWLATGNSAIKRTGDFIITNKNISGNIDYSDSGIPNTMNIIYQNQ